MSFTEILIALVVVVFVGGLIAIVDTANGSSRTWKAEVRELCLKNGHSVVESSKGPVCIPAAVK